MEIMPPGYRFYPTEEELISFYLHNKLEGERDDMNRVIPVVDIYDYNPTQLPQISGEASLRDTAEQWFFFIPRQESEARGGRPRRLTTTGYWKATGSPNHVYSSDNRIIGIKRTMVFYSGRAPNGAKTDWKMNEYTAIKDSQLRKEFSLCRVYKKSKCLRAFDRRPPARRNKVRYFTGQSGEEQEKGSISTSFDDHKHQMLERSATCSPESSSSGDLDHDQPLLHGQGETQMDVDKDPFLDWEKVDLFLGSEL
ncbi:hypothetical protein PHAVU_001G192000 [Phaseolus vulgaris]|uniref:NAC domain-containing protein n=1 Tax=Phaseolus vulgaris TaxID=3885 RepID=V7CXR1_PHAVU|nr:hypothetical protein PHAVU_001G192000g [Phaseolus vulgaris]ESW34919.1 hypothetical protein PHAVU_001G192000g [Phaseolus vulgaris]